MLVTPEIEEDKDEFGAALNRIARIVVRPREPMARHTSMKIGGPADYFIEIETERALAEVLRLRAQFGVSFYLLGNGSNMLVSDRGIRGAVLHLTGDFKTAEWHEQDGAVRLRCGAALAMSRLVRQAARRGYAGLEFAEGIPGTVGGALIMNAGAYGSEFERVVERVEALTAEGSLIAWERYEMNFTYRDSHLPPGTVATRVVMRLVKADVPRIHANVHELVKRRKSSQPSGFPNSGSMFRNPPGDFAGRLIEAAGLKGKRLGQAQISTRHANFIVNLGGAKAVDVRSLMELARAEVEQRFGIVLVAEVRMIGDWPQI